MSDRWISLRWLALLTLLLSVAVQTAQAGVSLDRHAVVVGGHPFAVWSKIPTEPKAVMLLIHGRTWSTLPDFDLQVPGEDLSLMDGLVNMGIAAYGLDLRGYGETPRDASGWLTPDRALLETALKKGAFARSFREGVKAPADIAARIEAGLARLALSALGLARRAGEVVTGFEKTRAMLAEKSAAVLVNAADGGEDGRRKLAYLAGDAVVVEVFAEAELAAALGRDGPTVHVGVKAGPAAQRFLKETRRLEGFRSGA